MGTRLGNCGVSFFVDNVFDSHTILNYNHQTTSYSDAGDILASPAYRYISYRPRTFGITLVYRQ
jgi:hypothetical protein